MTTDAVAVTNPERFVSLDILRGFAVLGILVMNIQSFSMIEAAYFNPTAYGDLNGINWFVWYTGAIFADTKFMAIFSMLFGASMLLIIDKTRERGWRPFFVLTRRNLVLLAVGFAHGQFLWHGDILYSYALCALFVFLFRNRSSRALVIAGLVVLILGSSIMLSAGLTADQWPEEQRAKGEEDWRPGPVAIEEELVAYRGDFSEQLAHRRPVATEMQTTVFLFYFFWRASGMMLIGMGLYKMGVLTARRSRKFYVILAVLGLGPGLALAHLRVARSVAGDWDAVSGFYIDTQFNAWGGLGIALGYVAVVMLLCQSASWLSRVQFLAPVGRMAFTNYLMQTLLCTTLFCGHGFGLFGSLERIEQMGVVIVVWALQIVFSALWLRQFRYGPAEWLWRIPTYLSLPSLRKH